MDSNSAIVVANHTSEGISLIGVELFIARRGIHMDAPKRFIDEVNNIPFLDREAIKDAIVSKYGIPKVNISFR